MPLENTSTREFARAFQLEPKEASDYLRARGQLTQTFSWQDLWHDEHARQFTVSRLTRLDLLAAMQDGITKSVKGDLSRRDWTRNTEALLKKEGWWGEIPVLDPVSGETVTTKFDDARLKLIFDTNTRMAYSAGQWERIWRNRATHPYVRYITRGDERVRESHRRWNNLTLPSDDPFWEKHWPPNGWRCRCRVTSMTQREFDKGYAEYRAAPEYDAAGNVKHPLPEIQRVPLVKEAPPEEFVTWTNKRTGEVSEVPVGVSPGFDYNPGLSRARIEGLNKLVRDKLAAAPAPLAKAAVAGGLEETGLAGENIGQFLAIKGPGIAKKAMDVAIPAIEKVHGVSGLPVIPVLNSTAKGFQGVYEYGALSHDAKDIRISSESSNPGLTALHEIGHFIDHQSLNGKKGFKSTHDDLMKNWRGAIDSSESSAQLQKEGFNAKIPRGRKLSAYYLQRHEQWARSYAQYIATRSGDPLLIAQIDAIRTSAHPIYQASQWSDDDFAPIGKAIDDLLEALGLKR